MSGDVAGGQIEGAAERDGRVGEIAADAVATLDDFRGGEVRPPGGKAVFNVLVNPITDSLHAGQAVGNHAEEVPGEVEQLVGIAVAAGQRVAEHFGRQFAYGLDATWHLARVGL